MLAVALIQPEKQMNKSSADLLHGCRSVCTGITSRLGVGSFVMIILLRHNCETCGSEFRIKPARRKARFCSRKCYVENRKRTRAALFWADVAIRKEDQCWNWMGYSRDNGYGNVRYEKRGYNAHQIAFLLSHGHLPRKPNEACHTCDNRICCNPKHLFEGTRKDNMADCARKGRTYKPVGELSNTAKLTEANVLEIRKTEIGYHTVRNLANRFNVGTCAIYCVIQRKTWRHI